MLKKFEGLVIFIFLLVQYSCNAPHSNPLDSANKDYSFVTINGTVQTYSVPHIGISDVSVYWNSGNALVKTDSAGEYKIKNIKPVNGILIFTKNGYEADTIHVEWNGVNKISKDIQLNKIPKLDSISIYTVVINQYYPSQTSNLFISTKISDRDNDISNVFVKNNQLQLNKQLEFNMSSEIYQTELSVNDLNIKDIEETIGLNFNIIARDVFNREFNVGSEKVTRVIKNGAVILSPANDTTIASPPELQWRRFTPGYPFTYTVEIYTNNFANSQLVESQAGIPSDSISYRVKTVLPSGDYYWDIWVIDKFNNRARSLPATFRIQ